jgi:predicted RNase H-like nuclease (RuvC/YqgF family)
MSEITENINDLLSLQGLDLTKQVFNHNSLSNFLIECRDEIEKLQSQYHIVLGAIRVGVERIEQLTSGPGGIMEMKQTIADKEERIEKLESQFKLYFHAFNNAASHIEKLETALEHTMECFIGARAALKDCIIERDEALKALEGK